MTCSKKATCWVLALSLLVNILLIGYLAGNAAQRPHWAGGMKIEEANLPEDKKAALKEAFAEFRESGKERRDEMRVKREEIIGILTAPEFDEAAFRAKSEELGAMFRDGRVRMTDRMANIVKTMTQEERQELAKVMRKPPRGMK